MCIQFKLSALPVFGARTGQVGHDPGASPLHPVFVVGCARGEKVKSKKRMTIPGEEAVQHCDLGLGTIAGPPGTATMYLLLMSSGTSRLHCPAVSLALRGSVIMRRRVSQLGIP